MKEDVLKALKFTKLKVKELNVLVESPKNPEMGDFAFPCFTLITKKKNNPHEIAKEIAGRIKLGKVFEKVEVVGPYVNFFMGREKLAKEVISKIETEKEKYGSGKIKENVVLEFPSPNTNKPLHLGHARNIILGQSVSKICKFLGNKVKIVNLNNDRGIHICKSMVAYEKFGKGDSPKKAKKKSDHFIGDYYVRFSKEAEKDKKLEEEAKICLLKWEKGNKQIRKVWEKMNRWALSGFKETYDVFGLEHDKEYFESDVYKSGKEIVIDALIKGKAKKKVNGAVYVDLKKDLGEKILLRADGTSIYITQDLYLAVLRQEEFKFDKSIYVTATEQNYHFRVLFNLLKKFGYGWSDKLYHLNYGMVHLESGRMKSREGNVVDIDNLINEMKELSKKEIEKRNSDMDKNEIEKRTKAIVMSALRYYFLKIERNRDLTFKPEESLSFEGDTGPYLLYSYARSKSILRKAGNRKERYKIKDVNDWEKRLLWEMSRFGNVVRSAYDNLAPNLIANYTFQLAQIFSEFYHRCPVIGSENESFRLKLVECFTQVVSNSLNLLDIDVIEKM